MRASGAFRFDREPFGPRSRSRVLVEGDAMNKRVVGLTLIVTAMIVSGCGPSSDTVTNATPAAAAPQDDASASPGTASAAAACSLKTAGWYKHPLCPNTLCYYAELSSVCGQTVYAYERDLTTNALEIGSGARWGYACHPAIGGHTYRGQWAIGASAGPKVDHNSSLAGLKNLPRYDNNDC
jgi:hypothetical protein